MKGRRAEKRKSYGTASVAGHGRRLSARHTRSLLMRYRASRYLSAGRVAHLKRVIFSRRLLRKSIGPRFQV
jgi:hypothetical protein